jgi:hypothetical protein
MKVRHIILLCCLDCPSWRFPRDAFESGYCNKLLRFMDRPIIPDDCPREVFK